VGSITTRPDDATFPAFKDVDVHLIFDEDSPALAPTGPFPNLIEVPYDGLLIEAGLKSVADYRSAEAVLANAEIAHHLTVDSVLYDPSGLLHDLMPPVRREFGYRRWVEARLDHERAGLAGALEMLPMAHTLYGTSGEAQILGYTSTYASAALAVATLQPPTTGSRALLRAREVLMREGRPELYERLLEALGLEGFTPRRVAQCVEEGIAAFDLAVTVRRTPHPAQHKLHAHLRPYFVGSCRQLLFEGCYRESVHWASLYYNASTDVILVDAPEEEREPFAARHARFLADFGLAGTGAAAERLEQASEVYDAIFALTAAIAARYPDGAHRLMETYAAP
jgi:hypothetical protein